MLHFQVSDMDRNNCMFTLDKMGHGQLLSTHAKKIKIKKISEVVKFKEKLNNRSGQTQK